MMQINAVGWCSNAHEATPQARAPRLHSCCLTRFHLQQHCKAGCTMHVVPTSLATPPYFLCIP